MQRKSYHRATLHIGIPYNHTVNRFDICESAPTHGRFPVDPCDSGFGPCTIAIQKPRFICRRWKTIDQNRRLPPAAASQCIRRNSAMLSWPGHTRHCFLIESANFLQNEIKCATLQYDGKDHHKISGGEYPCPVLEIRDR